MAYGLFPGNEEISWESHLVGSIGGIVVAFLYRKHTLFAEDPETEKERLMAPIEPKYPRNISHHTNPDQSKSFQYFYKEQDPINEDDTN